jgi:alkylation response protein AidB-like acyl-CoA dehydrogenase
LSPSTEIITELAAAVSRAPDDATWREAFRNGFDRLRTELPLHPAKSTASATFDAAAVTARAVAADCLPLGIAVVMHLYPLCALRCVPLPWWSAAGLRRARLLHAADSRSLILANAGSERAAGAHEPVTLTQTRDGIRVDGTYDYVSLAHVADVVMFSAPLAGRRCTVFCAADLRGASVRIGNGRFGGSMRLSDTCSVTFDDHLVPADRCIELPNESALQCMAQYQRSWFHLLLGESYLARVERLQHQWDLPRPIGQLASLNELAQLREYAQRLLDEAASPRAVESLSRVTAAMKLRISWLAQATATAMRHFDETAANELGYIRRQPTSDERILGTLEHLKPAA